MTQVPGQRRQGKLNGVGVALLLLVLLGMAAVVAGTYLVGGLGWALIAGGGLAVVVGLRLDVL